jgi:hypothetical protein
MISTDTVSLSYGMEKKTTTSKVHPLGTRGVLPDGRVFRYSFNGATAYEAGRLMQAAATLQSGNFDMDIAVESTFGGSGFNSIGDQDIALVTSDLTLDTVLPADFYVDGWLYVNDGPGEGHVHRISSHTSQDSDASTVLRIHLAGDDALVSTALTTASLVGLIASPYYFPVLTDLDTTLTQVVGVTPTSIAASVYYWVQTWGPAAVWIATDSAGAIPVVGRTVVVQVTTSDATIGREAGSVTGVTTLQTSDNTVGVPEANLPVIGTAMVIAAVDSDYGMIYLTISA